ncbi:MAG TPA: flagellar basal body P-ring formation chaperone FlgA [Phycisphaerales bacterium]|nr:flagellar basal body P-ring formation chaperone FlgA [Phycisphaerales bacterium]
MTRRRLAWLAAFVTVCVLAAAARGQEASSVALRTLVRVQAGAPVTLGDVAELRGEAAGLSAVGVVASGELKTGSLRVELSRVRELVEQNGREMIGRTSFSGSACVVRVATGTPGAMPVIEAAAPVEKKDAPKGETVRDHVRARIAQACGVDAADLRLNFEDGAEVLDMPTAGRTVAVSPAAMGDKMPLTVRVYRADVLVAQQVVRVGVTVRRTVLVSSTPLSRGSAVNSESLEEQEQWLAPSVAPATRSQVVGSVARARVEAGKVILAKDVEAPVVVQRGDLVSIDCVSGTVVVSTTARAKEAGREGDVIQFQSMNSKKTFDARVNGPGKAVLVAEGGL